MKVGTDMGKDIHVSYDKAAKNKPEKSFRVWGSIIRTKSAISLVSVKIELFSLYPLTLSPLQ
jgi:hypothetical protein